VAFPLVAGDYRSLSVGEAGHVYYLSQPATLPGQANPPQATLMRYDVSKRKGDTILAGVATYRPTPDGKKALVNLPPETLSRLKKCAKI
jgi:tricorn protease-like protein